jgi:hypothetical protein
MAQSTFTANMPHSEVFDQTGRPLSPPSFENTLALHKKMSLKAQANAAHVADIEMLVRSFAEGLTRMYWNLKDLAEVEPELAPSYMGLFVKAEQRIHKTLDRSFYQF